MDNGQMIYMASIEMGELFTERTKTEINIKKSVKLKLSLS
jgi:hypothetical protein